MTEKIERSGSEREVYRAIQSDGQNWFFTGISRAIMAVIFFDHRYVGVTGLSHPFLKGPIRQSVVYPHVGCAHPTAGK
jgi:hypothetical protein